MRIRYKVATPQIHRDKLAHLYGDAFVPMGHEADALDQYLQGSLSEKIALFNHLQVGDEGNLLKAYKRMKRAEDSSTPETTDEAPEDLFIDSETDEDDADEDDKEIDKIVPVRNPDGDDVDEYDDDESEML